MSEMRMLIIPAHLVKKIDENRGDLEQWEFLDFLIDSSLGPSGESPSNGADAQYVTREMLQEFENGMRELMRNFLDFVVTYGMELGKGGNSSKSELDALSRRLQDV